MTGAIPSGYWSSPFAYMCAPPGMSSFTTDMCAFDAAILLTDAPTAPPDPHTELDARCPGAGTVLTRWRRGCPRRPANRFHGTPSAIRGVWSLLVTASSTASDHD